MASQVTATPAAIDAHPPPAWQLHGPLMFHQSGGCCDGSAPMCYPKGEFKLGSRDVLLGTIADCEVYIGGDQYELWKHTALTIDAVPGRGAGLLARSARGHALPDPLRALQPRAQYTPARRSKS
jgi:uncharacterized protein (DUF779 family)